MRWRGSASSFVPPSTAGCEACTSSTFASLTRSTTPSTYFSSPTILRRGAQTRPTDAEQATTLTVYSTRQTIYRARAPPSRQGSGPDCPARKPQAGWSRSTRSRSRTSTAHSDPFPRTSVIKIAAMTTKTPAPAPLAVSSAPQSSLAGGSRCRTSTRRASLRRTNIPLLAPGATQLVALLRPLRTCIRQCVGPLWHYNISSICYFKWKRCVKTGFFFIFLIIFAE